MQSLIGAYLVLVVELICPGTNLTISLSQLGLAPVFPLSCNVLSWILQQGAMADHSSRCPAELVLFWAVCTELMWRLSWTSFGFTGFLPVFKDIPVGRLAMFNYAYMWISAWISTWCYAMYWCPIYGKFSCRVIPWYNTSLLRIKCLMKMI